MSKRKGKKQYSQNSRREIQIREAEKELRQAQTSWEEELVTEIPRREEPEVEFYAEPEQKIFPKQKWYVVDTNLILSCVDILYDETDEDWSEPIEFEPKLSNAHIVIPQVVFDELDHIKGEISNRGMIARIAFDRLTKFFPNSGRSLDEILNLKDPIPTGWKRQTISILPLHRNFSKSLPYVPRDDNNDGWIAITALAATMIREGLPIDGTADIDMLERNNAREDVVLLTNDKSLLSRADEYGVHVRSYSFRKRPVFSGIRKLTVPKEMLGRLFSDAPVTAVEFKRFMPNEPSLIANEYIVMSPENDEYPRGFFAVDDAYASLARFHKENEKICPLRFVKHEGITPKNLGIAMYYDALNDDKIKVVNVTGAAGTGKTFTAVVHAIREVKAGKYSRAVVISSQSAKNPLGALPGNEDQKMKPLVAAIKSAIESYVASTPEFKKKREELRKFGDVDDDFQGGGHDEGQKENGKVDWSDYGNRDARRTLGSFTGSFDDLDFMGDYSPEDFGANHSKKKAKKNQAYYAGKGKKKSDNGSRAPKMTYRELLEKEVDYLFYRYFKCVPYEQVQGQTLDDAIVILDEAQRIKIDDADTIIARPGENSKLILCGDIAQIHDSTAEKRLTNALSYSRMLYFDWEGCANIHLTENLRGDIARVMAENRRKVRRRMGLI